MFTVRDLAPPPSRWSRPASESAGAPWSLPLTAPHHPALHSLLLISHKNSTSSTSFSPSLLGFILLSSPASTLRASLSLSLFAPPSPSALLFLPHYVASFAIAAVVLIQKRNLRHLRQVAPHLSTSPPVLLPLLALQALVLRHKNITQSTFVKVNVLGVGERSKTTIDNPL